MTRNVGGRRHAGETGRNGSNQRPALVFQGVDGELGRSVHVAHLARLAEMSYDSRPLGTIWENPWQQSNDRYI